MVVIRKTAMPQAQPVSSYGQEVKFWLRSNQRTSADRVMPVQRLLLSVRESPIPLSVVVLPDRHRANPGEVHIGQARLLRPGVELPLHFREIALRFHLLGHIETGIA